MKQQKPESNALPQGGGSDRTPSLAQVKGLRYEQKATNQRVEELRLRLFHFTKQHMDQAVSLIRRWLKDKQ